jgi:hypothetical protein
MAKLKNLDGVMLFFCPGCEYVHPVHVKPGTASNGAVWGWNESMDAPTFTPSLLVFAYAHRPRCHSFIRDGQIQFLDDCGHALKNQTVEIPEWSDDRW